MIADYLSGIAGGIAVVMVKWILEYLHKILIKIIYIIISSSVFINN